MKNAALPINNLEDIVKSSYQVGVVESSSTYEAFKTSQYETYKKIWHRIQTGDTVVQSITEGIQWVRGRQEFVFINDAPTLRYAANQLPCDLTVGKRYNKLLRLTLNKSIERVNCVRNLRVVVVFQVM